MEAQAKIIDCKDRFQWYLYVEAPLERFMGISPTKAEAYARLHEVITALGLTLKFDISYK